MAETEFKYDVFISYSYKDEEVYKLKFVGSVGSRLCCKDIIILEDGN